MSDNDNTAPVASGNPLTFTDREMQLLGWAMQSLKSGPPEVDYDKLAAFASMSNPRSAGNAWAKIKLKLMTPSDGSAPPATPKKGGARKKAVKDDNGEEGESTAKKTPRKRAAKKQDVDGEASPKKKGRGKKDSDDEAHVNAESDKSDERKPAPDDEDIEHET